MIQQKRQIWEPNSIPQVEILSRSEDELLFGGSRGGGKTDAGMAFLAVPECVENMRYFSLVIRKDYDDLSNWLHRARIFYDGMASITGNPAVIKWNAGGVTQVGHWKDKNTISKYLGNEYWRILVEELTQTVGTLEEYYMLLGSLRCTEPGIKPQFLGTTNPGGKGHKWVKQYFVDLARNKPYTDPKTKATRIFIPSFPDDNPALSEAYKERLKGMPEKLRKIWYYGDWDVFDGMYFSNFESNKTYMEEEPFHIPSHIGRGNIYGSYDYGYGLNGKSSFGLWYLDHAKVPHRIAMRYITGLTADEQADDVYDWIRSFPFTDGITPTIIWYDNNMDNRQGVDKDDWSPIDYFKNRFRKHSIRWQTANKSRKNGWQIMLNYFSLDVNTGAPKMRYWPQFNGTFEDTIPLLMHNDNDPDDVLKCDDDHVADECRYGLVGIRSLVSDNAEDDRSFEYNNYMKIIRKKTSLVGSLETGWY